MIEAPQRRTQRASLGQDTSVRLSPRSLTMVDHETVEVPAKATGYVTQVGCGCPPAGYRPAPAFANESVKSDCSQVADGSRVVNLFVFLL